MKKLLTIMLYMALAGMSVGGARAQEVYDPIEPVNRAIFSFNEYADSYLLKPTAQAYDYVVPDLGKQAVSNVLNNLSMPVVMINSILQGDSENAFSAFWSFTLNTTFGIGGIFDFTGAATDLQVQREDFGQTLGTWGVGEGPYLVLPLMGPSNLRDTTGFFVDMGLDPYNHLKSDEAMFGRLAVQVLDARYQALGIFEDVYDTSFDPYATFRSAYTQRRSVLVDNSLGKQR